MDSPSITEQAGRPYISTGHFVLFGPGQGSLVTLLFNVMVAASPKELAGDVGSLRGTKIGMLLMAGLTRLAVIPAGQLPNYFPGQIPGDDATGQGARLT
jgi:hypothetical protein